MSVTFTIRVEGGKDMHRAIKSLCAEDGVTITHVVTQALAQYWGNRLVEKIESLCGEDGLKKVHMELEKSDV